LQSNTGAAAAGRIGECVEVLQVAALLCYREGEARQTVGREGVQVGGRGTTPLFPST
jgi:hypothetical protein